MSQRNDDRFVVTNPGSGKGALNDRWELYLRSNLTADPGPTSIRDLEFAFLTEKLPAFNGNLNDGWFAWLGTQGRTGTLADRWSAHWAALNVP